MSRGKKKAIKRSYKNPNGYGTVYKLSGNRRRPWIVRVPIEWELKPLGNNQFKKTQKYFIVGYAESDEEGLIMLADYHKNKKAGIEVLRNDATFEDVYNIAMPRTLEGKSKALRYAYQAAYKSLSDIHKMPVTLIKTATMQQCIDKAKNIGRKYETLSNMKHVCWVVFEYCLQNDIVEKNYVEFLKIPRNQKSNLHKPFTNDEIQKIINQHDHKYDTILIMIYTGIRINELLKIRKHSTFIEERYFVTGSKTDAGMNRTIPIAKPIQSIMTRLYQEADDYLIHMENGHKMETNYYRAEIWNPLMRSLGMDHLPHDCRHTFMTLTDAAGMNRVVQQKIVGHRGTNVTEQVYIHKDLQHMLEAVDAIWPC